MDLLNLLYKCKKENQELEKTLKDLEKKNQHILNLNKKLLFIFLLNIYSDVNNL